MNNKKYKNVIYFILISIVFITGLASQPNSELESEKTLYKSTFFAIVKHDYEKLKSLLPALVAFKKDKYKINHPMFVAIKTNNIEAVKILGSEKSLLNIKSVYNNTPLMVAFVPQRKDIFRLLLKLGADPNILEPDGYSTLQASSTRWEQVEFRKEMAFFLLDYKANPNLFKQRGFSPLAWSIMNNNEEYFDKLIQHKADPNLPYNNGKDYPLDTAITYENTFFVQKLLLAGADVNLEFETGNRFNNVMHNPKMLSLLISAGASINLQDKNGRTPLMYAAESGSKEAIIQFLNVKANITLKDKNGLTALDWLKKSGHSNLEKLFQ